MTSPHPEVGYHGPAEVLVDDRVVRVTANLRGMFQPIDGHYHWYGRIQPCEALDEPGRAGATVRLRTPEGEADGRLSDQDPWGRLRIEGIGRPPFRLED